MNEKNLFRTSGKKKKQIADDIVAFLKGNNQLLSDDTCHVIYNWVTTGPEQKTKGYFDIWDMVLDQYVPEERPILFRSCVKLSKRPIQSFSGKMSTAYRFSDGRKGHVLICDTREYMEYLQYIDKKYPQYIRNFFHLTGIIEKYISNGGAYFTNRFYEQYKGEDEYIVRVDDSYLYDLKWNKGKED